MALESQSVTLPNLWVRKLAGDVTLPLFSIRSPINDMTTYKNLGRLVILYRTEALDAVLNSGKDPLKGSVMVLSGDGRVMFDSSGKYYGEKYPYADRSLNSKETVNLDEESYITTAHNQAGYTVVGITPKREIAESFHGVQSTIMIAALLCIVIAVSIPSLMIVNNSKRTDNIIRFMRKVEKGEFVARMQDTKDDQLGQIAGALMKCWTSFPGISTRYIRRKSTKRTRSCLHCKPELIRIFFIIRSK